MGIFLKLILGNKKIVLYIVLLLLAIFIIWKYSAQLSGWLKRTFGHSGGDYVHPPVADHVYLSELANRLYSCFYSALCLSGSKVLLLTEANVLNDADLGILADEYKQKAGNTLYKDIDDEWLPGESLDETLMARLQEINKK